MWILRQVFRLVQQLKIINILKISKSHINRNYLETYLAFQIPFCWLLVGKIAGGPFLSLKSSDCVAFQRHAFQALEVVPRFGTQCSNFSFELHDLWQRSWGARDRFLVVLARWVCGDMW